MFNLVKKLGVIRMRIEDIYFNKTVKVSKKSKGTSQCIDSKVSFQDSKAVSNILNLMDTFIPFFRKE